MNWEAVTAMLVEFARGRGGYGALRSWFGQMPSASEGGEPNAVASMAGYVVEGSAAFTELSADEARDTLSFLAADSLVMPSGAVAAEATVESFARGIERLGSEARFFSNGRWHEYTRSNQFVWHGISGATFDAGVIGLNGDVAFIVWVEEDD
ncbi:hypothetical protein [Phenylobacterium sp.]|uniref:hypothetical protein n=1 Tax=Phenylobacterium sp. TaxID=1871053 RepID=UPI0035657C6F